MKTSKIKKISLLITIITFVSLFIASTVIYCLNNNFNKNIDLNCAIDNIEEITTLDNAIQENLNVKANDIYVFNGGEIEYDLLNSKINNIYFELVVRQGDEWVHFQLQNEKDNIFLINMGIVEIGNIKVINTLNGILEPISKLTINNTQSILKLTVDSVIHAHVKAESNNCIYNNSDWKQVDEAENGDFIMIISHDEVSHINTNDTKYFYIEYKEINL